MSHNNNFSEEEEIEGMRNGETRVTHLKFCFESLNYIINDMWRRKHDVSTHKTQSMRRLMTPFVNTLKRKQFKPFKKSILHK